MYLIYQILIGIIVTISLLLVILMIKILTRKPEITMQETEKEDFLRACEIHMRARKMRVGTKINY